MEQRRHCAQLASFLCPGQERDVQLTQLWQGAEALQAAAVSCNDCAQGRKTRKPAGHLRCSATHLLHAVSRCSGPFTKMRHPERIQLAPCDYSHPCTTDLCNETIMATIMYTADSMPGSPARAALCCCSCRCSCTDPQSAGVAHVAAAPHAQLPG